MELPDWADIVALALRLNKLPSEVDEMPVEWLDRLNEYLYHVGKRAARNA